MPVFSCFKFQCADDGSYQCASGFDISANLECAPYAPRPPHLPPRRRRAAAALPPRCRRAAAAPPPPLPPLPPFSIYHPYTALVPRAALMTSQPPLLAAPTAAPPSCCCRWVLADCAAHPEARCVATQATHRVGTRRTTWISTLG